MMLKLQVVSCRRDKVSSPLCIAVHNECSIQIKVPKDELVMNKEENERGGGKYK